MIVAEDGRARCDHVTGTRDPAAAYVAHKPILIYESEDLGGEEYAEVFEYCPECGERL